MAYNFATGLLGALVDKSNTDKLAASQQAAVGKTIDDQRRSRDEARMGLTGTAGDVTTSINPDLSFDSQFAPDSSSALLKEGDLARAGALNTATGGFDFTLPDLPTAQGVVDRDNALAQSGVDNAFNRAALKTRQAGSPGSSNFDSNLFRAQGDVADKLKANREQTAIGLLQGSQQGDLKTLQAQIQANQAQAPAIQGVGPSAAQVNAQIPLASQVTDPSSASTGLAASNLIAQIAQQKALEDSQAFQLQIADRTSSASNALLDRLLKSGSLNSGTKVTG
jgi:hypothetical protein